jgi:hypothetical protein
MQNNKKPNSINSSVKQALLDLKTHAVNTNNDDLQKAVIELLNTANDGDFIGADDIFNARRPSKCTWFKHNNATSDNEHALDNSDLSPKATWLLNFMTERMNINNMCSISRESVTSRKWINSHAFPDVIKELEERGYIKKAQGHSKGKATTYHISSEYACYGTYTNKELFVIADNEEGQPITILGNSKKADHNVVTALQETENGKVIRVNRILPENA